MKQLTIFDPCCYYNQCNQTINIIINIFNTINQSIKKEKLKLQHMIPRTSLLINKIKNKNNLIKKTSYYMRSYGDPLY